jgi:hypothetical protein
LIHIHQQDQALDDIRIQLLQSKSDLIEKESHLEQMMQTLSEKGE